MVRIPDETVNHIRQNTNILDVVSQYVQLNKSGQNHFAHCPFHEDNTPSFSVNEKKQIFYCFSCGRGGNVFKFIQEIDEVSFPESVVKVADLSNMPLDEAVKNSVLHGGHNKDSRKSKLIAVHEKASGFYHHLLMNAEIGEGPFTYLVKRGLKEETLKEFQIGYSPAKRNSLHLYLSTLEELNADNELLTSTGIFSDRQDENSDKLNDRFSNRILFPIQDIHGNIVGFSGRDYQDETQSYQSDFKRAKYLNSPETELFNKRNILFNFNRAKKTIKKEEEAVLFEGFMDVISSWQTGIQNGIASMGTSLTEQQIQTIERTTDKLVIAFDGDEAGLEAAKRIADLLVESSELTVEIVSFPEGLDPDDFIQERGPEAFRDFIKSNRDTFMSFLMRYYRKNMNLNNEAQRIDYIELILKELTKVSSAVEREIYIKQIAEEFDLSSDLLTEQVQSHLIDTNQKRISELRENRKEANRFAKVNANVRLENKPKKTKNEIAERMLLNRLFYHDEVWGLLSRIDANFVFTDDRYQQVFVLFEEFRKFNSNTDDFLDSLNEDDLKNVVTDVLWIDIDTDPSYGEIYDYVQVIRNDFPLEKMLNEKRNDLEEAKRTGDSKKLLSLTIEIVDLQRKLKNQKH